MTSDIGSLKDEKNLYKLLGIDKKASEAEIRTAYRKLALKYHPDRTRGDPEAAEHFKKISTAYAILSDPNKRRQYDLGGESAEVLEFASVNVEEMGSMGRVFGALFSRLGIPIPTAIAQATLDKAKDIADGRAEALSAVTQIQYGQVYKRRVDRQDADFYRLKVTEEDAKKGIVFTVRSPSKSKFKLVLFDSSGSVRLVQESVSRKKYTMADMYFTQFETLILSESLLNFQLEEEVPALFHQLDTLEPSNDRLEEGEYIFAVYGDNWLQKVNYNLQAVVVDPEAKSIRHIQDTEKKLIEKKGELGEFQSVFMAAKEAFETAMRKFEEENSQTNELLQSREEAYESFIRECAKQYEGLAASPKPQKSMFSSWGFGLGSKPTQGQTPASQPQNPPAQQKSGTGNIEC